jgi:outer membrane protein assembly factor BamB
LLIIATLGCGSSGNADAEGPAPEDSSAEAANTPEVGEDTAKDDTTILDAGRDSTPDTSSADTKLDATFDGGLRIGCGGESGLQAGSPWPMPGRCPSRQGRTSVHGPSADKLAWAKDLAWGGASAPTIAADGTLYVATINPSQIWALDATGATKWTFPLSGDVASGIALGADGTLYFGSNHQLLYAVSPAGALKWKFTAAKSGVTGDAFVTSPAIGADGTLYFGASDKKLYALNADGTLKWSYENRFSYTNEIDAAPALAPDGSIVYGTLGSADGWVVALKGDGTLKWSFHTGASNIAPPAIADDGTVYIGSQDKSFYALASDGTKKWSFVTGGRVYAGAAIASDGTVVFGSEDKLVRALRPDGTLRWSFAVDADVSAAPSIGGDDTIYLGPQKQTLYALSPDGAVRFTHAFPNFRGDHSAVAIGAKGELYLVGVTDRQSAIAAFAP